ncbi:hypothetical protein CCMA1212_006270 [Trichoderma ghanense]|uniref:SSCRP protein n=1 Tax=Trichoderma ghanense TaxID=65468 RepID=A0ABY2H154_9HYPO
MASEHRSVTFCDIHNGIGSEHGQRIVMLDEEFIATACNHTDTDDTYEVHNRDGRKPVMRWRGKSAESGHPLHSLGDEPLGKVYWKSYRHQAEAFAN